MPRHSWSMAEYLAHPAVSSSDLATVALKSPLDYLHGERDTTPSMSFGTLCHTLILEPHRARDTVAVWREKDKSGKAMRRDKRVKVWAEFEHANREKQIVLPDEYERASKLAAAVRCDEQAGALLTMSGGEAEVSITHNEPGTGLDVKLRPDWLTATAIVDVKILSDLTPHRVWSLGYRLGYHIRASFYQDMVMSALRGPVRPFYFLLVGATPPHEVAVLEAPYDVLDHGREQYSEALESIVDGRATGAWPGRMAKETFWRLPAYANYDPELEVDAA